MAFRAEFTVVAPIRVSFSPPLLETRRGVFTTYSAAVPAFGVLHGSKLVIRCTASNGVRWECETVPSEHVGLGLQTYECGDGKTFHAAFQMAVDAGERSVVVRRCWFAACIFNLTPSEREACEALLRVGLCDTPPKPTAAPTFRELAARPPPGPGLAPVPSLRELVASVEGLVAGMGWAKGRPVSGGGQCGGAVCELNDISLSRRRRAHDLVQQ